MKQAPLTDVTGLTITGERILLDAEKLVEWIRYCVWEGATCMVSVRSWPGSKLNLPLA